MPLPDPLGPWAPLSVAQTRAVFEYARVTWWVSGGQALDLYVGRLTREHSDIDVSVLRTEAPLLHRLLLGWDLQLAHQGALTPWTTPEVDPPCSSAWCRPSAVEPWRLQVMFEDGTPERWICRRHPDIELPMRDVIAHAPDGTPFMAPQLQLFMKAKDTRPKDDADFATVTPLLSPTATRWLQNALQRFYPTHPWLRAAAVGA